MITNMHIEVQVKSELLPLGKVFQAIVSVIAVNIQFSSPSIVLRSFSCPGILNKGKGEVSE